ncbi:heme exporter protein CcmB [Effusibacillus lacus]|uniref:Heme exporter protein B n=1 Tax=Effusibacillus lacus TaxID=1348429 RepID=A0A292YR36_9BACL|nr:heme exporter protein CcmB [Effusibacillus lacus]TCS76109.1 heme exporter protein B [Effusibacillus lacus]GAX91379.1 transcriptional regulator [Effusibacillus lacus]
MANYLNAVWAIAWKDLASELRTKEMIGTMLIFAGLVIVVFSFAFDPTNNTVRNVVPGLIWVIAVFSGILGLNRSFMLEKKNDNLTGLLAAPADPSAIYLGKLIANLALVAIVELLSVPILFLLFDYRWQGELLPFLVILVLGTTGFIIVGTFMAALSANSKSSEMLLPIVLFPVITPILIGAVQSTKLVLAGSDQMAVVYNWMKFLAAYDLIFLVAALILFEYLMEV